MGNSSVTHVTFKKKINLQDITEKYIVYQS